MVPPACDCWISWHRIQEKDLVGSSSEHHQTRQLHTDAQVAFWWGGGGGAFLPSIPMGHLHSTFSTTGLIYHQSAGLPVMRATDLGSRNHNLTLANASLQDPGEQPAIWSCLLALSRACPPSITRIQIS